MSVSMECLLDAGVNELAILEASLESQFNEVDTLLGIYKEIESNGVSKNIMVAVEDLLGEPVNVLYPLASYTEHPSKTNLIVATEGLLESITKAIGKTFKNIGELIKKVFEIITDLLSSLFKSTRDAEDDYEDTLDDINTLGPLLKKMSPEAFEEFNNELLSRSDIWKIWTDVSSELFNLVYDNEPLLDLIKQDIMTDGESNLVNRFKENILSRYDSLMEITKGTGFLRSDATLDIILDKLMSMPGGYDLKSIGQWFERLPHPFHEELSKTLVNPINDTNITLHRINDAYSIIRELRNVNSTTLSSPGIEAIQKLNKQDFRLYQFDSKVISNSKKILKGIKTDVDPKHPRDTSKLTPDKITRYKEIANGIAKELSDLSNAFRKVLIMGSMIITEHRKAIRVRRDYHDAKLRLAKEIIKKHHT